MSSREHRRNRLLVVAVVLFVVVPLAAAILVALTPPADVAERIGLLALWPSGFVVGALVVTAPWR